MNLFLKADKIISSVSDLWVNNIFDEDGKYMRDLYHFEYIYLQNGIIKDDLSFYLHKIMKNFDLMITSSKEEYNAIFKSNYADEAALAHLNMESDYKKLLDKLEERKNERINNGENSKLL